MRRRLLWQIVGISGVGCGGFMLFACIACGGAIYIIQFAFDFSLGWALYCYRVIPEVRPSVFDVAMAILCVAALAVGSHWLFRWLYRHSASDDMDREEAVRRWPRRWTGAFLALIAIMFASGMAAIGVLKQTTWLATSPLPLSEDAEASNYNPRQIAFAVSNYEGANGALPPAAITDREGRPLLSWRVAILPKLEHSSLYAEFHLNEPWDSPHNLRLMSQMPYEYASFSTNQRGCSFCTNYRVFVGDGTAFEQRKKIRLKEDFPNGADKTILIVEAREAVPWTKPDDLPYSPERPLPVLGPAFRDYFFAVTADGRVVRIDQKTSEQNLRAWITRIGEVKPGLPE